MLGIILILGTLAFYMWRLFVFANAISGKKEHTNHVEEKDEVKPVKGYSIHRNVYE